MSLIKTSRNVAPSLADLPQELMDGITSLLTQPADISSLSKTSKAIRAAVVGSLFENITMVWSYDGVVTRGPRIDCLLRTILEEAKYTNYISKINLQGVGFRADLDPVPKPELPLITASASYAALVKAAIYRTGIDRTDIEEQLETGVIKNNFDAVIALVLLLCPKVTSLILGLDILIYNFFLPDVLKYAFPTEVSIQISRFQSLRNLKIGTNLDGGDNTLDYFLEWPEFQPDNILNFQAYLPLFYLPNLEDVEMSLPRLAWDHDFWWPTLSPPKLLSLSTLRLPKCSIVPEVLRNILSATPNLASLEYDCWLYYYEGFDTSELAAALETVKSTLVHLKISIQFRPYETLESEDETPESEDETPESDDGYRDFSWQACALKSLVTLKTLSIPSCVLLGWRHEAALILADVLPPNVVSVRLQDDCYWYDGFAWDEERLMSCFQALLVDEQWKTIAPHLQDIGVSYREWTDEDRFRELCELNGLTCTTLP